MTGFVNSITRHLPKLFGLICAALVTSSYAQLAKVEKNWPADNAPRYRDCFKEWKGDYSARDDTGTWRTWQRNTRTWVFWLWRGSQENERAACPWSAAGSCSYSWGQSRSVTKGSAYSFSVTGGLNLGSANNNFLHGVLEAGYNKAWGEDKTYGVSFLARQPFPRGTMIEPIIAQQRGLDKGDFYGFYKFSHKIRGGFFTGFRWQYCYFGPMGSPLIHWENWKDNFGSPYRSYHITPL